MKPLLPILIALAATLVQAQHDHAGHTRPSAPPAVSGDIRSLDVYADRGKLHLLIAAYNAESDQSELLYLSSDRHAETWTQPIRIDQGQPAPYARGRGTDFQIAANGDLVSAIWMTKGSGFMERGPLVSALSRDGGKTWTPAPTPADDGTDGDHAFIDAAATPDGSIHAVWLDTRTGDGKGLIAASSTDRGQSWRPNVAIDAKTCECCWNTLKTDAAGYLYCLYRDIDPRDMGIARSIDNGQTWNNLPTVGTFDWQFNGCPHVGGALAIENAGPAARLHALVWTGKEDRIGLYYQNASAPDFRWSAPQPLGGRQAKHGDIAIDSAGRILRTYTEASPDGATLLYSISGDSGKTWSRPESLSAPANQPSHPRAVALGETIHLFWTEKSESKSVWKTAAIHD